MDAAQPICFDFEVPADGRIQMHVPLPAGSHIKVLVIAEPTGTFDDLIAAAESSTDFWNNSEDDEDWNHA
jgi:hypothetical protein